MHLMKSEIASITNMKTTSRWANGVVSTLA